MPNDNDLHRANPIDAMTGPDLARARAQAAADLDVALAAVAVTYQAYLLATAALGGRVGSEVAPRLETPEIWCLPGRLSLCLARTDPLVSLRDFVAEQHARAGV